MDLEGVFFMAVTERTPRPSFRASPRLRAALDLLAARDQVTFSHVVRRACRELIERELGPDYLRRREAAHVEA